MKRFCFVTGTDTNVGKTTVGVGLLAAWNQRGFHVTGCKPVETGIDENSETSETSDGARLAEAIGIPVSAASFLRFRLAACPETAALVAEQEIRPEQLLEFCATRPGENILVEGAGGLLVPLAKGFLAADFAQRLNARLLIVARTHLGTLNHTLLTLAEARRRGLTVAGVVLNQTQMAVGNEENDVPRLVRQHGGLQPFGPLPFSRAQTANDWAALTVAHLPVDDLFACCFGP